MDRGLVLVITVFAFSSTCTCECPDAWVYFRGSCYLFSHEARSFTGAKDFCYHHQSHLVKVDSMDENTFLKSHCTDLKDAHHWIGLTDADIEGIWQFTDGSSPEFRDWGPGEPNGHKVEDCAVLYYGFQYKWADLPCANLGMPICEMTVPACQSSAIIG